jgi:hypothetical protein
VWCGVGVLVSKLTATIFLRYQSSFGAWRKNGEISRRSKRTRKDIITAQSLANEGYLASYLRAPRHSSEQNYCQMLCQTARRLLTVSNKLTVLRSTHNQIQNNVLYKCSGNRTYSSVGSGREKLEASEQDTAVAIFEKITRKDALINLLSREISTELRQNIILNPDRNSKLRHIEVTEDKIRLEYSHITPQFTVSAHCSNIRELTCYAEVRVADASEYRRPGAVPSPLSAQRCHQSHVVWR